MSKYSVKNICFGIGVGLVISSIINLYTVQKHISLDQLKREAEYYNMKLVKNETLEKAIPTPTPIVTAIPEKQVTPTENNADNPQNNGAASNIEITVEEGETIYSIADLLVQNKLITDKNAFVKRIEDLDKDNKVQVGSFKIPVGASADDIINIITTAP